MATFYLKYRPQTISELDLENIREQLSNIVKSGKIPHAFLFAGPRGAGKTSAARILAKVVNCLALLKSTDKGGEPCNKCSQCQTITKGTNLDVIEIDAASNRGVDDIRSLREAVKLAPSGSNKKIYIIDEAHMLTLEAANALLKTLEEPPSHVLFILATTLPDKLPETIRSRCTLITFRKATPQEVVNSLDKAVKGEGLNVDKKALEEIATRVDGSFREAHKILEQLSFEKGKITKEKVLTLLVTSSTSPLDLLQALAKKDAKSALAEIDRVAQNGANLKNYTQELISILRRTLLANLGIEEEAPTIEDLEKVEDIKKLIELFSQASISLSTAVIPQLPLELASVKWCLRNGKRKNEKLKIIKPDIPTSRQPDNLVSETRPTEKLVSGNLEPDRPTNRFLSPAQWQQIMSKVKQSNYSAEALLRAARPSAFDGQTLKIEVFYAFHKERLEHETFRTLIEKAASEVLATNGVKMICFLSPTKQRATDLANISKDVEEDIAEIAEKIFGSEGQEIN